MDDFDVVTGAFGFTGKYITERLLKKGRRVRTITGHPGRANPFAGRIEVGPLAFDQPDELVSQLRGSRTLYNTYWIRFPYRDNTFDRAVANSRVLIDAALRAGVQRLVHISIAHADAGSKLPYYSGKGLVEQAIIGAGVSYAIVRPTVMYGLEGILLNNIAWLLRHFPVFAVPGSGHYGIQPVFVDDVARIAVDASEQSDNLVVDAVGPELFTFDDLVHLIRSRVRSRALVVHFPHEVALALAGLIGRVVGDVVLTRDEVEGLMADLLVSRDPPTGQAVFSQWLERNANQVGKSYFSELARHYQ